LNKNTLSISGVHHQFCLIDTAHCLSLRHFVTVCKNISVIHCHNTVNDSSILNEMAYLWSICITRDVSHRFGKLTKIVHNETYLAIRTARPI